MCSRCLLLCLESIVQHCDSRSTGDLTTQRHQPNLHVRQLLTNVRNRIRGVTELPCLTCRSRLGLGGVVQRCGRGR